MIRLGIDIDGVLSDFIGSFRNIVNSIWSDKLPPDWSPALWDLTDELTNEEREIAWEKLKETENFWLHEAPYRANVEELNLFLNHRRNDTIIYYITSRVPTLRGESVMIQTQNWLDSFNLLRANTSVLPVVHELSSSGINKLPPPKDMIVQALDIHAHIDDYLPTVNSLGSKGWLLDRTWNRTGRSQGIQVVPDLAAFLDYFTF